jgi:hypothetical protein
MNVSRAGQEDPCWPGLQGNCKSPWRQDCSLRQRWECRGCAAAQRSMCTTTYGREVQKKSANPTETPMLLRTPKQGISQHIAYFALTTEQRRSKPFTNKGIKPKTNEKMALTWKASSRIHSCCSVNGPKLLRKRFTRFRSLLPVRSPVAGSNLHNIGLATVRHGALTVEPENDQAAPLPKSSQVRTKLGCLNPEYFTAF